MTKVWSCTRMDSASLKFSIRRS